jgi:hypothetical protein
MVSFACILQIVKSNGISIIRDLLEMLQSLLQKASIITTQALDYLRQRKLLNKL